MENIDDKLLEEYSSIISVNNTELEISIKSTDKRFISVIELFCTSLIKFALTIDGPLSHTIITIRKKYIHSSRFDKYVIDIELFNNIINDISIIIKSIILSLNKLFVEKNKSDLVIFIDNLRKFLIYNIENDVFETLTKLKKSINAKYKKDNSLLKKITTVNNLIFRIFDITIDITAIFVPGISVIKKFSTVIEQNIQNVIDNKLENVKKNNIDMSGIIKNLIDIDLRSQIIASLDMKKMLIYIEDKQSDKLIEVIEHLQVEYITLIDTTLILKNEIITYKNREKNIFSRLFNLINLRLC